MTHTDAVRQHAITAYPPNVLPQPIFVSKVLLEFSWSASMLPSLSDAKASVVCPPSSFASVLSAFSSIRDEVSVFASSGSIGSHGVSIAEIDIEKQAQKSIILTVTKILFS